MKNEIKLIEPDKWSRELQIGVTEAELNADSRYEDAMDTLLFAYINAIPFAYKAEKYFEQLLFRPIRREDYEELNSRIDLYLSNCNNSSTETNF